MSSLPMLTPAGGIAVKLLAALRITTVTDAVPVLALWARPPKLTASDVRGILAELDQAAGEVHEREADVPYHQRRPRLRRPLEG